MPPSPIHKSMTTGEWGLLVALSVLWGASFFFIGVAVAELPPFTIVVARVGLAALALHAILRWTDAKVPVDSKVWRGFLALGLLNNVVPFSLIVWGQTQIASGLASILNATTPLFAVAVAHIMTRDEKMTGGRLLGVAVGFAGVAVMTGVEAFRSLGSDVLAQIACLGGALSYATGAVYGRRFRTFGIPPMVTAAGQVTASFALLLPVMLIVDQPWTLPMPSAATLACVIALALLSTALAYVLFFRILATAGAVNLLLVTFLIPITAIVLGVSVLDEHLTLRHTAGMALIGLGLAAIDGRLGRRLRL